MSERIDSIARPAEDDLALFDSLLRDFPSSDDAAVLYTALDWYTRALSANNIFSRFLSYYVAIESVATAMAEGSLQVGPPLPRETKAERRARRIKCIQERAAELLPVDPIRFAVEAYGCVQGLSHRTRVALAAVFGDSHPYMAAMFDESDRDGWSLNDLRNSIAHGTLSLLNPEDEALVSRRSGEVEQIAREFLARLIFKLREGSTVPSWSELHGFTVSSCDPRATLAATHPGLFPCKDWKIRPEWCD